MRRLKRSTLQTIIVAIICIIVVAGAFGAAYFIYVKQLKQNYQVELDIANKQIQENQIYTYIAVQDIKAGENLTEDKLEYKQIFSSLPEENYITKEDLGKLSVIDINSSVPILKNMVTKDILEKDLREEEFNVFYLNSNLQDGDYIDIRLLYPNGEDYIVLSKKAVKNLSLENQNCFLWLNAEEILTISGAIVDAFINDGSKLYTVKYIEPLIQEPSTVTYTPSRNVIDLIKRDPNVVQRASLHLSTKLREELENRLGVFYSDYDQSVTWNKSVYDIDNEKENAVEDNSIEEEEEGFYVD